MELRTLSSNSIKTSGTQRAEHAKRIVPEGPLQQNDRVPTRCFKTDYVTDRETGQALRTPFLWCI